MTKQWRWLQVTINDPHNHGRTNSEWCEDAPYTDYTPDEYWSQAVSTERLLVDIPGPRNTIYKDPVIYIREDLLR